MTTPINEEPRTWEARLKSGKLSEDQLKVLDTMVVDGDAESLEEAARILDFKDRDLNLDDAFYGF